MTCAIMSLWFKRIGPIPIKGFVFLHVYTLLVLIVMLVKICRLTQTLCDRMFEIITKDKVIVM